MGWMVIGCKTFYALYVLGMRVFGYGMVVNA